VFRAIRDASPNATDRHPGDVLAFVSCAIRAANAPLLDVKPLKVAEPNVQFGKYKKIKELELNSMPQFAVLRYRGNLGSRKASTEESNNINCLLD